MRFQLSLALTAALFALPPGAPAAGGAQDGQGDQKVIDDFITTRGVTFEDPVARKTATRPSRPSPSGGARPSGTAAKGGGTKSGGAARKSPGQADVAGRKNTPAGKAAGEQAADNPDRANAPDGPAGANSAALVKASAAGGAKRPIGLGFTLFMKQGENLVAADPAREFKSGDRLRLALETNTDGHLYIFHTENGQNPQMIFPHPQIDAGANLIGAHSRDFVPADLSAWFEFDQEPATERLYIVVARSPLAGVPAGEDLVAFCGGQRADCYWKPSAAQWERIKAGAPGGRVVEARNSQLAKLDLPPPPTLTRGLKVTKSEPAPAIVRVNDKADADVFVTTVDLIHK